MPYSTQASDRAFQYITDKISSGEWVPGMKIETEEQLCSNLEVSRIAVRQAMERLSAMSVLKKVQGSGTYVNKPEDASLMGIMYYPFSAETMLMILEFRRMFDPYNSMLCASNASPEEKEALRQNYEEMITFKDDPQEFQLHDISFHHMIAEGTHNFIIRQTSSMLTDLLKWHQKFQYDNIGPDNSIKWHGRMVEAICAGDGEFASVCARIHIDNSIRYIKDNKDRDLNL